VLEERACARRYPNLASLITAIVKSVSEIPFEVIRECIDERLRPLINAFTKEAYRLRPVRLCIAKKGGHFK